MSARAAAPVIEEIAAALISLSRALTQVKTHETLCKSAGVDLDRAGAALVYKLYAESDNVRISELADRLAIDAPAVTRKVQQLERHGLVARSPDPHDARASLVKLTAAGRRTIERLLHARQRWLEDVLADWKGPDRAELARLLGTLASSVADHEEPGRGT